MAGGAVVLEAEVEDVLNREEAESFSARMTWLHLCSGARAFKFVLPYLLKIDVVFYW